MEPKSDEEKRDKSKTYPACGCFSNNQTLYSISDCTQHKSRCPLKDKKIKSLQRKIDESP